VIEEAVEGRLELILPRPVLAELERVLTQKLRFEAERWRQVEAVLLEVAAGLPPELKESPEAITGDPADDVILAHAVESGADSLVSGDRRHLLPVGEYRGVRVITPQALLAELAAE